MRKFRVRISGKLPDKIRRVKIKIYIKPDLTITYIQSKDIICTSVEHFSSYIDGPGDWGDDPIIDPDDDIIW